MNTRQILKTAQSTAREAGELLLKHYGKLKTSEIAQKTRNDFVTKVDKMSEELVVSRIKKKFKDHAVLGEEGGASGASDICWIIDPLDGTSNYIHHFPMFAVSIGVTHKDEPVAGVIYDPVHDELFSAEKGGGAFLNRARFRSSKTARLADALMATGIPFRARNRFDQYFDSLKAISLASAGMRRGGSAALDIAYVACGRFDAFWEINLSPWDIAAGAVILKEAGGRISDVLGRPEHMKNGDVLASNGRIHRQLEDITKRIFS